MNMLLSLCFVLLVLHYGLFSDPMHPMDTLQCIYLGGRTVNCTYDIAETRADNFSCSTVPFAQNTSCEAVTMERYDWSVTRDPGICATSCDLCRKHLAISLTADHTTVCKVINLVDIFQPYSVKNLKIESMNKSHLVIQWSKPDDDHPITDTPVTSYLYDITVRTDKDTLSFTLETDNKTVRAELDIENLKLGSYNISVVARWSGGGYTSKAAYISGGTKSALVQLELITEEKWAVVIIVTVIAIVLMLSVSVLYAFKRNPRCCQTMPILLPKFDDSVFAENLQTKDINNIHSQLLKEDSTHDVPDSIKKLSIPTISSHGFTNVSSQKTELVPLQSSSNSDDGDTSSSRSSRNLDVQETVPLCSNPLVGHPELIDSEKDVFGNCWSGSCDSVLSDYRQVPGGQDNTDSISVELDFENPVLDILGEEQVSDDFNQHHGQHLINNNISSELSNCEVINIDKQTALNTHHNQRVKSQCNSEENVVEGLTMEGPHSTCSSYCTVDKS